MSDASELEQAKKVIQRLLKREEEYKKKIEHLEIESEAHLEMLGEEEVRSKAISEGNARKKKALREKISELEEDLDTVRKFCDNLMHVHDENELLINIKIAARTLIFRYASGSPLDGARLRWEEAVSALEKFNRKKYK